MNAFDDYTGSDHVNHCVGYGRDYAMVYKLEGGKYTQMSGRCDHNWKWVSEYMTVDGGVARARLCSLCDKEEVKLLDVV